MSLSQDFIDAFAEQSLEELPRVSALLVELEREFIDGEDVDEVMRLLHTLKGGSGMLGYTHIRDIAHSMESLIQAMKKSPAAVDPESLPLLFRGCDELEAMVERVRDGAEEAEDESMAVLKEMQEALKK